MRAAIVDSRNVVRNIIEYDPESGYEPPAGSTLVSNPGRARIGSVWNGEVFEDPLPVEPPRVEEPPGDAELQAMLFMVRSMATQQVKTGTLKFEDAAKVKPLFSDWRPGLDVVVGELYVFNNELVEVIQSHTTQSDWEPSVTPALWKTYRNEQA